VRPPAIPSTTHPPTRPALAGFTLIESLIVIAIVAILAAIGVPSLEPMMAGARISAAGSALRSGLELARSEAMTRGGRAAACRSTDSNAAAPTCSDAAAGAFGAGDWAAGWIVYAKAAANVADTFEAGDQLVRRQPPLAAAVEARAMVWAPAAGPVVYGWNGVRLAGPVGSFSIDHGAPVSSRPSPLASHQGSCVLLNVVGRVDQQRTVSGVCP
jgi:type IV fimbrial biogenesis protein FimT